MIEIEVNNNRTMVFSQPQQYEDIYCQIGENNNIDTEIKISAGDMVMLINYYSYIKNNNIQCDFINPSGKIIN